jgi:hypothetical protein
MSEEQRWPRQAFVHLAVHYPKPEHAEDRLASMRGVDDAAQGAPGLISIGAWRDLRSGRVIGLALWESKEAFDAAIPGIFASLDDPDPDGEWDERPADSFHLVPGYGDVPGYEDGGQVSP